jgi:hypothetical protein
MLRNTFSRSRTAAVGRPSPRAVDLTPEQQKQLADAGGKVIGAIVDTIGGGNAPPPPPPPPKSGIPPIAIVAGLGLVAFLVLRKR